ncbi:MAG: TrkH family potassium uptake protein, partial [Lentisphaeria bacterium]|nr:TrkH family potassium uptake protein [Lentisphaeria bacterium]
MSKHYSIRPLSLIPVLNTIGVLITVIGVCMVIPLIVAWVFGDGDADAIGKAAVITIGVGGLLFLFTRHQHELTNRQGFVSVTISWVAAAVFGALPMYFGTDLSYTDSFFEAMSGFTTTGASILTDIEAVPHGILFWRSLTHWLGGMGIIVFTMTILPLLGRGGSNLYAAEVPGPISDKLTPRISETAKVLWGIYALITLIQFLLLWVGPMDWFDALCHTFGTIATGGFSTKNASISHYHSAYVEWVVIIFMIIGGSNFALHYFGLHGKFWKYIKSREFCFWMTLMVVGVALILFDYALGNHYTQSGDALEKFRQSPVRTTVFNLVSLVTATGFASNDFESWSQFSHFILLGLMLMGGMAGSTAGGIKAIRILYLLKLAFLELKRMIHPRGYFPLKIKGTEMLTDPIPNTTAVALFYFFTLCFVTMVITFFGRDLVTAGSAAIATISTVGPGLGMVGPTDNYAFFTAIEKWVMSIGMLLGRLEFLTVLVIFH